MKGAEREAEEVSTVGGRGSRESRDCGGGIATDRPSCRYRENQSYGSHVNHVNWYPVNCSAPISQYANRASIQVRIKTRTIKKNIQFPAFWIPDLIQTHQQMFADRNPPAPPQPAVNQPMKASRNPHPINRPLARHWSAVNRPVKTDGKPPSAKSTPRSPLIRSQPPEQSRTFFFPTQLYNYYKYIYKYTHIYINIHNSDSLFITDFHSFSHFLCCFCCGTREKLPRRRWLFGFCSSQNRCVVLFQRFLIILLRLSKPSPHINMSGKDRVNINLEPHSISFISRWIEPATTVWLIKSLPLHRPIRSNRP